MNSGCPRRAVFLLLIGVLAAACSSGSSKASERAEPARTPSTEQASTTTTTTSPSPEVGSVVTRATDLPELCPSRSALSTSVSVEGLLADGLLAMDCASPDAGNAYDLVTVRVDTHEVGATVAVKEDAYACVGMTHLFVFSTDTVPPTALKSSQTELMVDAYDAGSGVHAWQADVGAIEGTAKDFAGGGIECIESPSGGAGSPAGVFIRTDLGSLMLDAATGNELWRTDTEYSTLASGSYVANGIVVVDGMDDNMYGEHWTGLEAQDGHVVWDVRLDGQNEEGAAPEGTYRLKSDSGVHDLDLQTGNVVMSAPLLESWQGKVSVELKHDPLIVGVDDAAHTVSLVRAPNTSAPLWTIEADEIEPVLVTAAVVIVKGPRGLVLLSTKDGSVQGELGPSDVDVDNPLSDGLGNSKEQTVGDYAIVGDVVLRVL
jgi:hypothetical protein